MIRHRKFEDFHSDDITKVSAVMRCEPLFNNVVMASLSVLY